MNDLKCLIVDDESIARRIISSHIEHTQGVIKIGECHNAIEAHAFLRKESVDIIFLDLEMPRLKGFDFLDLLDEPPIVIITTAHREFALEGFEYGVADYLLKPISLSRFQKAIVKALTSIDKTVNSQVFITVKSDRQNVRLDVNDILYIEGMSNYIKVHTTSKNYMVYNSLANIYVELSENFIQVHKSFIINTLRVTSFTKEKIYVEEQIIPIGKKYKEAVLNQLHN